MKCSCPDWAGLCKHLAAVLYGVGARLDEKPELLFFLRSVNHEELLTQAAAATDLAAKTAVGAGEIAESDMGAVFGIELDTQPAPAEVKPSAAAAKPAKAKVPKATRPSAKGNQRKPAKAAVVPTPVVTAKSAKRRRKAAEWINQSGLDHFNSEQVFNAVGGGDLIDATCAVPFSEIATLVQKHSSADAVTILKVRYPSIMADRWETFVPALSAVLNLPILFQLINPDVITDEAEYIRFFRRLGQGGTALTADELTYSLIKQHFPWVPERMKEITASEQAGRLASEVNLVLASLRVAKVSAPWGDPEDWQIFGRPQPSFISRLREELPGVREEFQRLIPNASGGRLKELLESIWQQLVYDEKTNPTGLPVILLAHLPHQLIAVLLLMEVHRQPQAEPPHFLPAFVLDWLLYIADPENAANIIFKRFCQTGADWQLASLIEANQSSGRAPRSPN